jgi:L-asparagine transporter-like permease
MTYINITNLSFLTLIKLIFIIFLIALNIYLIYMEIKIQKQQNISHEYRTSGFFDGAIGKMMKNLIHVAATGGTLYQTKITIRSEGILHDK